MAFERRSHVSDHITHAYIDSLLVEVRHLDAVMPSTEMTLLGKTFSTPVATAALSHLSGTYPDGMAAMAQGAAEANALVFSGMGVFKALALGATGCCVGRPLMPPLREHGPEGVRGVIESITKDLRYTMAMTASPDITHIDRSLIRHANFHW